MKVVVIYFGQRAHANFVHSQQSGVWGFKEKTNADSDIIPGNTVLFASGYSGNIRLPEQEVLQNPISLVATALIVSPVTTEDDFHWPDEVRRGEVLYRRRFKFSNLHQQHGQFQLNDAARFPLELSRAIRQSGITLRPQVVELPALPAWLYTNGSTVAPPLHPKVISNPEPTPPLSVPDTLIEIQNFISSRGFVFSERVLRCFYASMRSKPFVILAGNSGTGKSRLVRLFAEAAGATIDNGRFTMIPVRPDWNDGSELIGYFDLNGEFIPGKLISPLLMASVESTKPFFVCLDEMNLARVEHYFSDFLSIIESRRRVGNRVLTDPVLDQSQISKLKTEGLRPEASVAWNKLSLNKESLRMPENLFVVGTVNMDETTQPFSRKVLDRANTMEFNEIDLMQSLDDELDSSNVMALDLEARFFRQEFTSLIDLLPTYREKAKEFAEFVQGLNKQLVAGGFEVGYRVRDEAISFAVYGEEAGLSADLLREAIVLQKILPRIQGSSPRVEKVLLALMDKLSGDTEVPEVEHPDFDERLIDILANEYASAVLRKVISMLLLYREENFTSFWLAK